MRIKNLGGGSAMKKFNSISSLMSSITTDKEFSEQTLKEIKRKRLAKFLFALRCQHHLTQKQIAKKINCSQSRISKIEGSYDEELSIQDLTDYANALHLELEIGYRNRSTKIIDLIKYHAFKIKHYLDTLLALGKDDAAMNDGIANLHIETLYNLGRIILYNMSKMDLKTKKIEEKRKIHISPPLKERDLTVEPDSTLLV